jgi:acetyl-CoA acyltransferase 1
MARTAMTKAKRGPQKDTSCEAMLVPVLKAVVQQSGIDPNLINDICIGNVLQPGAGAHTSRLAQFIAGIPETATLSSVNRQCSSGLQAVMNIANSIRSRQIDIGIGGGVESMSLYAMDSAVDPNILANAVFETPKAQNCLIPMGITSENVTDTYKISREK